MSKINIHNYEAYFLDFAEGTLSAADIQELEAFLVLHPELRSELEAFDPIIITDDPLDAPAWDSLKKPTADALKANLELREQLYFDAVEDQLDDKGARLLKEILREKVFAKEFALWQKTRLNSGSENIADKDHIYNFGLDEAIGPHNYEAFLIARTENLLSAKQNAHLEAYAKTQPSGEKDLLIADKLQLKPSMGIFFPDKEKLKKQERTAGILWLYRVAAVMVVALGVWIFMQNDFNSNPPIAEDRKSQPADTSVTTVPEKITPIDSLDKTEKSKLETPKIEEWEIREPDPVEYAESAGKDPVDEVQHLEKIPIPMEEIQLVEVNEPTSTWVDPSPGVEDTMKSAPSKQTIGGVGEAHQLAQESKSEDYQTLVEIAEDKIAKKLELNDSERDALAISVAKRLTDKAGELLDAEVKRESSTTPDGENMTYTLRVGSFKLSRTKSK
jgi:hypothetical protein